MDSKASFTLENGTYEVVRPISQGGQGQIHIVRRVGGQEDLVAKFYTPEMEICSSRGDTWDRQDKARQAYETERGFLIQARQDNQSGFSIPVDGGSLPGAVRGVLDSYVLVMTAIDGITLEQRIKQGKPSREEAARIARGVGDAVAYAHGKEVIHRDIKPRNIMLSQDHGNNGVVVLDWAAGKGSYNDPATNRTVVNTAIITGKYTAPEVREGRRVSRATDVFNLGMVLAEYFLGEDYVNQRISGELIPRQERQEGIVRRTSRIIKDRIKRRILGDDEFQRLTRLADQQSAITRADFGHTDLPSETVDVLLRAIDQDSGERYQTINDFVTAFTNSLSGMGLNMDSAPLLQKRTRWINMSINTLEQGVTIGPGNYVDLVLQLDTVHLIPQIQSARKIKGELKWKWFWGGDCSVNGLRGDDVFLYLTDAVNHPGRENPEEFARQINQNRNFFLGPEKSSTLEVKAANPDDDGVVGFNLSELERKGFLRSLPNDEYSLDDERLSFIEISTRKLVKGWEAVIKGYGEIVTALVDRVHGKAAYGKEGIGHLLRDIGQKGGKSIRIYVLTPKYVKYKLAERTNGTMIARATFVSNFEYDSFVILGDKNLNGRAHLRGELKKVAEGLHNLCQKSN